MEKERINIEYESWEKNLYEEYKSFFPNAIYTITDGVVCPKAYSKAGVRIMLLLREAYDKDFTSYSKNRELREDVENGHPMFGNQKMFVPNLTKWLATVSLIAKDGFLRLSDEEVTTFVTSWNIKSFRQAIYQSAYVNIKKSDGKPRSSKTELRRYCSQGWKTLTSQIKYMNPTVIIGGNVIDEIMAKINKIRWGETLTQNPGLDIPQLDIDGHLYPILNVYHPSATTYQHKPISSYYLEIFHALRDVEIKYPGYWRRRLAQKCFNSSECLRS